MSWWQTRKARKNLEKIGLDKTYLKGIEKELKEGVKQAEAVRDELRKQESPEYIRLVETLNQIVAGNAPTDQKKLISIKLVEQARLSDWEKHDLLEQVEGLYSASK
jgi:hypothetical protein